MASRGVDERRGSRDLGPLIAAGSVFALLMAVSGRYGYHRDSLYFLAAGHHLAWGYPDQPPFTPALARLMSSIAPGSLPVLVLPSAIASAVDVVLTARLAKEFGASRGGQTFAAVAMATAPFLLGAGHLLSTATFNLLSWTAVLYLVVRVLRTGHDRLFVVTGVVAGLGLLDSDLLAFLLVGLGVAALFSGPREIFRSRWLWVGVVIAVAMWTPYLVWQAHNGWPELTVSRSIAAGNSGSSTPRWALIPFQFFLGNVWLSPVWVVGLWRLFRAGEIRWARAVGWCWVFLVIVLTVSGGKAYYLTGMLPVLLAAGAQPSLDWARRKPRRLAGWMTGAGIATLVALPITLPLVPLAQLHKSGVVAANYDAGEQVAWPAYVNEITAVAGREQATTGNQVLFLASNYGEAGALERYAHVTAYSGDMGFWWWGPPHISRSPVVIAVGFDPQTLLRYFDSVTLARRLDNHLNVDNDEQGASVRICTGMRADWASIWPKLKTLG
jgi:4-amino-4-deoxy-L-arabinose transferase-like glycosyltransferase